MAKKTTTGKTSARKKTPGKRKKGRKKPREIRISLWVIIGVLVVLTGLVSLPYIKERKPSETGAPIPVGAYCYGIDISHYQHEVEWDSLMVLTDSKGRTIQSMKYARDIRPVSYVFIKATEGNSMKDKKYNLLLFHQLNTFQQHKLCNYHLNIYIQLYNFHISFLFSPLLTYIISIILFFINSLL